MKLPARTTNYIANGAQEGSRNDETFHAACQMRDAGLSEQAAIIDLVPRAVTSGLGESEAISSVKSAYRGAKRESIGLCNKHENQVISRSKPKKLKKAKKIDPKELPAEMVDGIKDLLRTCFKEGEWVAIGDTFENEDGEHKPTGGTTYKREMLLETLEKRSIQKMFGDPEGIYIRVNPVVEDGKDNKDVTAYRHVLVEFDRDADGNNIPKELQYGAILDSGMPISAVLDSGNKSIHAWIKVDAADKSEYKERVNRVWDHFEHLHLDQQNRNESRYSRCPGVRRRLYDAEGRESGWGKQALLAVNVGAANWSDWEEEHPDDDLPVIQSTLELLKREFPTREPLIDGILLPGKRMVVGAPSKSSKTWILLDCAMSLAGGVPWMGMQCRRSKVLYIDFEIGDQTFKQRLEMVMDPKFPDGYPRDLFDKWFDYWDLEGHVTDIEVIVDKIIPRISNKAYDVVVIDPLYKSLAHRKENDTSDMNNFLGNLTRLSKAVGCSVIYVHHYRKSSFTDRFIDPIDLLAGSGVIGRDANSIMALKEATPKGSDIKRFSVHTKLREFPEKKVFYVKRMEGSMVMEVDTTVYATEDKKEKDSPKGFTNAEKLYLLLPADPISPDDFYDMASRNGIPKASYYRSLKELREAFRVIEIEGGLLVKSGG
jgi:RecA-family ATPase